MQKVGEFSEPKVLRRDLPEAAQKAILKAMSFDKKDRYVRAQEFSEELNYALTAKSVTPATKKSSQPAKSQTPQIAKQTTAKPDKSHPAKTRKDAASNSVEPFRDRWAGVGIVLAALASIAIALNLLTEMRPAIWLALAFGLGAIVCGKIGWRTSHEGGRRATILALVTGVIAVVVSLALILTSRAIKHYTKVASVRTLTGHSAVVTAVTFSPDSKTVASASADKSVMLWDAQTGQVKQTLKRHGDTVRAVAFSSDGSIVGPAVARILT